MSASMPMPMPNLTLPSGFSVPLPSVSLPYMPSVAPGTLPAAMPQALNLSAVSMGSVMPLTTAQLDAATAAASAAATQRMFPVQ